MKFVRFPRTPHLAWLGEGKPRDDKVLSREEAHDLLSHEVLVEEKVDGANIGVCVDEHGMVLVQGRGSFLSAERCHAQFGPLFRWLAPREKAVADVLSPHLLLFGEWCYATHSVHYTKLPDHFLAFDVYDRKEGRFWSADRRNALVSRLGLELVPRIAQGHFDLPGIERLLGLSQLTVGPAEGLYVRQDRGRWLHARAKLVRPEFMQQIDEHWTRRSLRVNLLAGALADDRVIPPGARS